MLDRKQYYLDNKTKINERQREYYREVKGRNYFEYTIRNCKRRAKMSGLPFDLTTDDLVVPKVCPYLGIEICLENSKPLSNSPSIDRIDNTKGYTKDNVQVISQLANSMKSKASEEELITFAENVLAIHKYSDWRK